MYTFEKSAFQLIAKLIPNLMALQAGNFKQSTVLHSEPLYLHCIRRPKRKIIIALSQFQTTDFHKVVSIDVEFSLLPAYRSATIESYQDALGLEVLTVSNPYKQQANSIALETSWQSRKAYLTSHRVTHEKAIKGLVIDWLKRCVENGHQFM
jgi:uncharacterized protein YqiB (DUF1249 family)